MAVVFVSTEAPRTQLLKRQTAKLTHRLIATSSDFTCSLAGTWVDDALSERKQEMAKANFATTPIFLTVTGNKSEECEIDAGKWRGVKVTQIFDQAWADSKDDP